MSRHRFPSLLAVLGGAALLAAPLGAQTTGAMPGFQPTSEYVVWLDGASDPSGQVYVLNQSAAYLVLSDRLPSPLLLEPRAGVVRSLSLLKVAKQSDGTVTVLPQAVVADLGPFEVDLEGVRFTAEGREVELRAQPPYLGSGATEDLLAYSADYSREAALYVCSEPILRDLRAQPQPVRVRVFFGSWCPHCKLVMPRILKVAQQLAGSRIALEFYGLPRDIGSDAEANRLGIDSVPTGVVLVGEREVARINDWKVPELAIREALAEASS